LRTLRPPFAPFAVNLLTLPAPPRLRRAIPSGILDLIYPDVQQREGDLE